jgi:hypothetical protein
MYPSLPFVPMRAQPATVDTDERRAVVRRLTDALYDYLTLDVTEMERHATMRQPTPESTMAGIMQLQERIEETREKLEAAQDKAEAALIGAPEGIEGMMRVQLDAVLIEPLKGQLQYLEQMLSERQKEMESQSPLGEGTIEG